MAALTFAAATIPTKAEAADLFIPRGHGPVACGGAAVAARSGFRRLPRPAVLRRRAVSMAAVMVAAAMATVTSFWIKS
jgi:hypothetical protein